MCLKTAPGSRLLFVVDLTIAATGSEFQPGQSELTDPAHAGIKLAESSVSTLEES